jgi:hypothetical protein
MIEAHEVEWQRNMKTSQNILKSNLSSVTITTIYYKGNHLFKAVMPILNRERIHGTLHAQC